MVELVFGFISGMVSLLGVVVVLETHIARQRKETKRLMDELMKSADALNEELKSISKKI